MQAKKRKPYKPRSLAGAADYVRCLRNQIDAYEEHAKRANKGLRLLAMLAAKGPAFSNPLDAWEAETIRDDILRQLGMKPDGSPK